MTYTVSKDRWHIACCITRMRKFRIINKEHATAPPISASWAPSWPNRLVRRQLCRGCVRCARQAVCDAALAWPQRPVVWSFSADEIGAGVAEVARICDVVVASMWVIGYL